MAPQNADAAKHEKQSRFCLSHARMYVRLYVYVSEKEKVRVHGVMPIKKSQQNHNRIIGSL